MSQVDAVRRFNRFYTRRIGVLTDRYLGREFTLPEARVLYELGHGGPTTATALGRALELDLGYLSRLLQGLKRRRLLQAARSSKDGRQSVLSLSSAGRKAYAALDEGSRRATAEMLAPLEKPRRQRLVDALDAVQAILEKQGEAIRLRTHRPGDIGWIVSAHGERYAKERGWGPLFEGLVAEVAAAFLRNFDARRERCWIVEAGGERVGSVLVVKKDARTAQLRLLLVAPHARGSGLGKRLVGECIAFARRCGYRKLMLWTHEELAAARAIYARAGFRLVRTQKHRQFGIPVVGEYWERAL
jgi:DNA-binding MarR family transcriptional regulator/N-acetylglutamate synthase-like GNAT family acetyltransferase